MFNLENVNNDDDDHHNNNNNNIILTIIINWVMIKNGTVQL